VISLQPPYSLIHRQIETETLPYCEKQGIGVIVYSPMASGLLTGAMTRERAAKLPDGDWRKHSARFREPTSKNLKLVERLKKVAARYGRTPGEVAIASTLLCSSYEAGVMLAERRGQVIAVELGPTGHAGRSRRFSVRPQPSCDGTSRMMREYQVRFCERLGVKFPGPIRTLRNARYEHMFSGMLRIAAASESSRHLRSAQ
jgi:hypothetical protein